MHITPAIVEAAYEYLRSTPPFSTWSLPPGEEVEFVVKRMQHHGEHSMYTGTDDHIISLSSAKIEHSDTLLQTIAHEMVHVRQALLGEPRTHNKRFRALAAKVCREHGWDRSNF